MLKKTIMYEDYNGATVQEDFYFNLSRAELVELEVSEKDGFGELLKQIIASEDRQKLIEYFKKIILMTYGVKSDDGKRFMKSDELRIEFSQTAAFSALFEELATDDGSASAFIRGVIPAGMADTIPTVAPEEINLPGDPLDAKSKAFLGEAEEAKPKTWQDFTRKELVEMSKNEFDTLVGTDSQTWPRELLIIAMQRKA